MTRELLSMTDIRAFLGSEYSRPDRGDSTLTSQVELWNIGAKVFDTFGADIERTSPSYVNSIEQLSHLYDEWLSDWRPILSPMGHLLRKNNQSRKPLSRPADHVLNLYVSAAKLQLFSHIFRGPAQRTSHPPITLAFRDSLSKSSSQAVYCAVQQMDELASLLESGTLFGSLPMYLAIMVAFSSIFLTKISRTASYAIVSENDKNSCIDTIRRFIEASRNLTDRDAIDSINTSTSQALLLKIIKMLNTTMQPSLADDSLPDASLMEGFQPSGYRQDYVSPHTSHEPTEISTLNVFDEMDMFLDLDFNFVDGDNFAGSVDVAQGAQTS